MTNIHIEDGVPPLRPEKDGFAQWCEKCANAIIKFLTKPEPRGKTEEEFIEEMKRLKKEINEEKVDPKKPTLPGGWDGRRGY